MRVFETLRDAGYEARRDVYKGSPIAFTRVQNFVKDVPGRERLMYSYAILPGGVPKDPYELLGLGMELEIPTIKDMTGDEIEQVVTWMNVEMEDRTNPLYHLTEPPADKLHPALAKCVEGDHYSYTYKERLYGAIPAMAQTLAKSPDSRRCFWPIFHPMDSLRANSPTRVPCSLGYQAIIRRVGDENQLHLVYLQRSSDFDQFWLTDVWMAKQFQLKLLRAYNSCQDVTSENLAVEGMLFHDIISFHSFTVEGTEIY